ncbi:hypothetical protein GW17_00062302 [Ensete ventricosum]|nr:hypothetical protein GW17_00062302 [Ensete ventricosum]RZR95481.1 hypothetical protein BHM03_00024336 [Ensete ventricosum]
MAPWLWASAEATLLLQALLFTEAGLAAEHQVRCKNTKICSGRGVKVIITDLNKSNDTDLVLSRPAYVAMARRGMGKALKKLGIVDVEYKR